MVAGEETGGLGGRWNVLDFSCGHDYITLCMFLENYLPKRVNFTLFKCKHTYMHVFLRL